MVAKFATAGGSVQVKKPSLVSLCTVIVFSFFFLFSQLQGGGGAVLDNRCESLLSPPPFLHVLWIDLRLQPGDSLLWYYIPQD